MKIVLSDIKFFSNYATEETLDLYLMNDNEDTDSNNWLGDIPSTKYFKKIYGIIPKNIYESKNVIYDINDLISNEINSFKAQKVDLNSLSIEKEYYITIILNLGTSLEYPQISYSKKDYSFTDALNVLHKVYSQSENSLPFIVTGWTSSYKETGYYPEVPNHIKNMETIKIKPYKFKNGSETSENDPIIISMYIFKVNDDTLSLEKTLTLGDYSLMEEEED